MKSILLVDDDPHIMKALTRHIRWNELGLQIAGTASDGLQALELFRTLRPDMVMTDVYIPGLNGLELTQALRKECPGLPIVILSGYDEFENARTAMRWGVNHFLLKPASVDEIEAVLRDVITEQDVLEQKRKLELAYKQEIGKIQPYLREKLLLELLTTRYRPDELLKERFDYVGLSIPQQVLAVSLQLSRPGFVTKLKERDWQLLKFGAGNIIRETLEQELSTVSHLEGHVLDYSDELFVLLMFSHADAPPEKELPELTVQMTGRIVDKISTYLKMEATAGIGSVRVQLCEVIDSYLESREALETAEFQGMSRVYPYEGDSRSGREADDYTQLLKQWNDAWSLLDPDKAEETWGILRDMLREEASGTVQDTYTVFVSLFHSLIYSWNSHFPVLPPPIAMKQFLQEIQQHYALKELIGWMDTMVEVWLQAVRQELSEKKSNRLVDSVKAYVVAHYAEEISFAALAKGLYAHPKYVSQLFKRVTGENFVSYLNRYRIERAVELLQSGRHMVYEVSEMVGFNNATYFSQVFKMITGKSPSEYLRL
ncbi:response regulator transcription factor [Paenibacillus sp. y28]|uniref:response regulator transcription factor n=1 Tax=Paenibacillus sp. y28 TaxID=3129110 RepID=UPI003016CA16